MTSQMFAEVIGDPIDHSLSPLIHTFWLEALGIDAAYGRRRVSRPEFAAYVAERRSDPLWRGSNITMPLPMQPLWGTSGGRVPHCWATPDSAASYQ